MNVAGLGQVAAGRQSSEAITMWSERLELGRKPKSARRVIPADIQWLDAEGVTRGDKSLTVRDDEGEHPVQLVNAGSAEVLIKMQYDLRVAARLETMHGSQVIPQMSVVVDLTVAHQREALVLSSHGLSAALDVDNRQACVSE
jgi:hypothetical protein